MVHFKKRVMLAGRRRRERNFGAGIRPRARAGHAILVDATTISAGTGSRFRTWPDCNTFVFKQKFVILLFSNFCANFII